MKTVSYGFKLLFSYSLDLPINTNNSFEVPSTHTDFLKHIPNSKHSHS